MQMQGADQVAGSFPVPSPPLHTYAETMIITVDMIWRLD